MDWKRCWCASRSWALAVAAVQICSSFFTVVVTAHALVQGVPVSPGIEASPTWTLVVAILLVIIDVVLLLGVWKNHQWMIRVWMTEVSRRLIPDPSSVAQRGSVAVVEDQIIW
ncbi:unnamed protein product [Allacma fusca]|uniref:Uncharacterized protein n=1 Tax=Allacma fusca TaxID=39272 RepID=A0A8J2P7R2_9HEXA|nr:unnamed protein product [Allacma fusca]